MQTDLMDMVRAQTVLNLRRNRRCDAGARSPGDTSGAKRARAWANAAPSREVGFKLGQAAPEFTDVIDLPDVLVKKSRAT